MCLHMPGIEDGEGNGGAIVPADATVAGQKRPFEERTNGRKPSEV